MNAPSATLIAPPTLMDRLRQLYNRRETIRFLVMSNLKAGHRDKFLGRLWSLLDPLLFMLVYLLIFGISFRQVKGSITEFMIFLLCGLMPWRFFEGSIAAATGCVRSNRGLIHEINFPKAIFPTSICLARLSDLFWGFIVLFGLVLIAGREHISLQMLWVLPLILILVVFTLGCAYAVAYMGAFFADTANLVSVALRFLFYLSPMFYHVRKSEGGIIPDHLVPLYMLNPIACFFEAFRNCIIRHQPPDPMQAAYLLAIAMIVFFGGFFLFTRGEGHFAKYI